MSWGSFCLLIKQYPKSSEFAHLFVQNLGKSPHLTVQDNGGGDDSLSLLMWTEDKGHEKFWSIQKNSASAFEPGFPVICFSAGQIKIDTNNSASSFSSHTKYVTRTLEMAQNREKDHTANLFLSPCLQWSSHKLLKFALDISLHIRPGSQTQHIFLDTTWKAVFALWSKWALKLVRDPQGKALPDYSFVCACDFPLIDTAVLLRILTSIILVQCSSPTDFLTRVIQEGAAVQNVCGFCFNFHAFLAWYQSGSNTSTVQSSSLGMIYVPHTAALVEIILIYTILQPIFSSN